MNICDVYEACMSPTPSISLVLQCVKLSDVVEIRNRVTYILSSIRDCHTCDAMN